MSGRRLYVYFRVAREHEAAAVAALRSLHAQWPQVACELLRRSDERGGDVTLMETYVLPDAQWLERIEREAAQAVAPWLIGGRHVEVFETCHSSA